MIFARDDDDDVECYVFGSSLASHPTKVTHYQLSAACFVCQLQVLVYRRHRNMYYAAGATRIVSYIVPSVRNKKFATLCYCDCRFWVNQLVCTVHARRNTVVFERGAQLRYQYTVLYIV